MSVATIHDLTTASRGPRPARPVPHAAVDAPASVTVTVRIDLPDGQLPAGAADLVESLRALAAPAATGPAPAGPAPAGPAPAGPAPAGPGTAGPAVAHATAPSQRPTAGRPVPAATQPGDEATLRVFLASRVVVLGGVPVRLTRREFDLLAFFCAHPRQVFDRRQLLRQVWGYEMVSGERTVDVHVRRLRVKLGEPEPLIVTVRGVGYRLDDAARVVVVAGPA
jgi:hypothetical protein